MKTAQFDRYQILELLCEGGMGRVYRAVDTKLQRIVAVKVIVKQGENDKKRFQREIQTTAKLKHPNIVQIFHSGHEKCFPFFAMEFIDGGTLSEFVEKQRPSIHNIAVIMSKVAEAVAYAHDNGVIHRDLKPDNIMMDGTEPKVVDFGLAKVNEAAQKLSKTGTMLGTVHYMSPEQTQSNKITKSSDIYSLGVILYKLLCGRLPFTGNSSPKIVQQIIHKQPVPLTQIKKRIPIELEIICLKCLEKRAKDRYQDARRIGNGVKKICKERKDTYTA